MAEPGPDRESVDRAFAELIAGYHLTADRPDPLASVERQPSTPLPPVDEQPVTRRAERAWAEDHPLFHLPEPVEPPAPDETPEPYEPEPLPPLSRPGIPALLGWIGIGFAALVVLCAGFGLPLPAWVGWLAVGGFVGGFAILLTRLPRHRPPDAGDGAVL